MKRGIKMKVLILANNDVGLYKFRKELLEQLLEEHDVYVSLPKGEYISDIESMGCKFIETKLERRGTNPIKELLLINRYRKIVNEVKPDIVFSYTIKPNIYGGMACASLGIPYVSNITGLGTAVENRGILQKVSVILYKIAFRKVQRVFFQNDENMQFFIEKKIALGRHVRIPGSGVNLQYYQPLKYPSDETIEFVFISRIMREKGIDQYLDAAEYVRRKYPNTKFHVCGFCEQEYEERLKKLHQDGVIIYHGMVRDVREVLKDVHCTIHPTYYPEGLSNVLLESSACARPIITTNRSGCREVVDDRINGYIANQQDSKDLIDKVEEFISISYEKKQMMGLNARSKVEREFDRKIVIANYMKEISG
jgi:glycosyltransferase involved in cell wall biosynthesis